MKHLLPLFSFCFLISISTQAQTTTTADYFAGKWTVLVKGTPNGDAKMIFSLEKKDQALSGTVMLDPSGANATPIDNIEMREDSITLYFNAGGFDVNLSLKRKDNENVTGSLMSMFVAEGTRTK